MVFRPAVMAYLAVLVLLSCGGHTTIANRQGGGLREEGGAGKALRQEMRVLSDSNHKFTSALYKELSKVEGNVFFSPFSIHTVLTMTSLGSGGATERQFKQAMHLPVDSTETKKSYKALFKNLKNSGVPSVTLKSANKIYTNQRYQLNEKFKTLTSDIFNSKAENVDFDTKGEEIRDQINEWVENNTNKRIKDLIAEGSLTSETAMVLVNAIFFKGKWATEFDPADTKDKMFHLNKDQKVKVPMMHVEGEFSFKDFEDLDAQVLELFYTGDKISMLIILPKKIDGLAELERRLANDNNLENILKTTSFGRPDVSVILPKFKMEHSAELTDVLKELGMTDMFASNANFTGMLKPGIQGLKISKVAHKAFLEVNEEGSEAAAATSMLIVVKIAEEYKKYDFVADHPFLFLIRHRPSRAVLFMGRIMQPRSTYSATNYFTDPGTQP